MEEGLQIPNESFHVRVFIEDEGAVGYVKIPSFSGGDNEVEQFAKALESFESLNVKGIVLDLVNNGGGSIEYGLKLAALLKSENASEPSLKVRINDNWLNSYHSMSLFGNDSVRELARRRYQDLKARAGSGERLSEAFHFSELMLSPKPVTKEPIHVVLMVNEMCASMCDIFTADLKDNGIAKVIGKKTMGAGGNVVQHGVSPRLNLILSQTESLVVRANDQLIENQGIKPDKAYEPTLTDLKNHYSDFIEAAVDYALE